MGTRADFYVGRGMDAEWLGSIGWNGYPNAIDESILAAEDELEYRKAVTSFLNGRDGDATFPKDGWPWPWDDSLLTDYSYTFDDGMVYAAPFGHYWFPALDDEPDLDEWENVKSCVFPNMEDRKRVTLGKRSGLIAI